ncbi:MAG TPA: PAS domain-containing sensor histidine kinase [Prolixibacteraceae bacterium]|nr:PAS domain-containing sensor histidine kinase [Prolixibacteraceae bacterium]
MEDRTGRVDFNCQLLLDNSFDAIFLTATDGNIYMANKAASEMFGYTVDEICAKGRNGIMDQSDPRLKIGLETRARTGKFIGELTAIKKDGSKFPNELSSAVYKDHNGKEFTCIVMRDISKRISMENSLAEQETNARAIMESTNETLILIDKSGLLIDCNESFARRVNSTREQLLGSNIYQLFPPFNIKNRRKNIEKAIDTGEPYFMEYKIRGHWYDVSIHPVRHRNQLTNRVAIFSKDITAQKKAEQVLRENEIFLRKLNSNKDKFFSIVAHDLKNPLNAIVGFSEMLQEKLQKYDHKDLEDMADIIHKSSMGIAELLENLMTWASSQTGRLTYHPQSIDLIFIISNTINLLSAQSQKKSIIINVNLPLALQVKADQDMMNTVVRNLVSNAIKYTDINGTITVTAQNTENETIVIVEDNGIGINKERLDQLFQTEHTLSANGTQNEKGTGLGLIICKEFIEIHGGRIWAESEPGKGSTFGFSIPL